MCPRGVKVQVLSSAPAICKFNAVFAALFYDLEHGAFFFCILPQELYRSVRFPNIIPLQE